jgi:signal transduction histidine kinase/ligand-binding sensor domain-containing protein/DNA-binding response OmpR family regulator
MERLKIKNAITLLLALLAAIPCFAIQNISFEWIGDRDGLSQNTVRCILQDSKGFIWFGTINGLNRYNGREFIVMNSQSASGSPMSDNRMRSLLEDRDGYIWARTLANTFSCYNPKIERFVEYLPANSLYNFSKISLSSNGDVWLYGRNSGCCRISHAPQGLKSTVFSQNELGSPYVNFIHEDGNHHIWLGSDSGIYRLDNERPVKISPDYFSTIQEYGGRLYFINTQRIVPYDLKRRKSLPAIPYPAGQLTLNMVSMLNSGLILIANRNETLVFDCKSLKFVPAETVFKGQPPVNATFCADNLGNTWIYNLTGYIWKQTDEGYFEKSQLIPPNILATIDAERYEVWHDSRGIIWITTYGNGLFAIDTNNGQTYHYTVDNSDLPTNYLLCVMEDNSGEIWVGTEFSGISKISLSNYPVEILNAAQNDFYSRSNAVRLLFEDSQNRFWMGTRNGYLHIYDSTFNRLKSHKISGGLPFCMVEDRQGNFWLGTRGNGIDVFPPSGAASQRNYHLTENIRYSGSNSIFDLLIDSRNRLWAATFGGGLHYASLNGNISFSRINLKTVNQDQMRVLIQDKTGVIWVGTNEGAIAFNPDSLIKNNSDYLNFRHEAGNERSINNNEVKAIYEDSKGRLWFGTTGGGLNLLVRENPLRNSWFKHYTALNGLSNEVIQTILEDDEGYIWVSTEGGSGISKFDTETERFENFSFSSGKQGGLFNEGSRWKMKNGKLMFGSYSGVYIFDPKQIKYDDYRPPVVITGLKINGADVRPGENNSPLKESISQSSEIRLNYLQNSFNIEFAMLNFHAPYLNQYSYYLEGYEKTPNPVTRHNVAAYRNVPPGNYTFKVRGSNSFGVWTDNETELKIVITPPFWKSVWAYLIYFVLLIAAIIAILNIILRFNRLHNEVAVERQLTEYKLRFFTNISHEFRTPLTIIRGAIESLASMENIPSAARKSLAQMEKSSSRLMRLIDQLLEFRKLQNKGLELQVAKTEAVGFFNDILQSFREMAEKKNIDLRFESNVSSREMLLDRGKFDKIAYNLLSNAMKYTPENGIILMKLVFAEAADRMILSVSDNGRGIPKDKQASLFERFAQFDASIGGTGVGLHLTSELASVHLGKAEYADSDLGGACFIVSVPLADANYEKYLISEEKETPQNEKTALENQENEDVQQVDKRYGSYKILVIEDEDEVREFVCGQLDGHFNVIAAKNGSEGLEIAEKEQPDLIVCDVMMPGIDGFEVTRRLKEDFLSSHIPIILLTAHSSEEYQLEGIRSGADSYIVKPFSVKYLIARIVKLIEQREKLHRKFATEPGAPNHLITYTNRDKEFLDKIDKLIEKNIENIDFSVDEFARNMGMGRTNFFKKVKGITGHSPNEYLRVVRMKKAAELLTTTDMNVSEVSYKVGINDPFYFSKCFKAQFGKSPSQWQKGE